MQIKNFYDRFWQEEEGIVDADLMQKLPVPIQAMVSYDIYKNSLDSCCLLEDLHPAVKRNLSQYMTKQVHLPGWKIIEKGAWLDTYIYISYGVAQVQTDEDDESSIFSMGVGSGFGSSALLFSRPSKVDVKAATYCITHQLRRQHLFHVLSLYKDTNRLIIASMQKNMQRIYACMARNKRSERESGLKALKDNLNNFMTAITISNGAIWFSDEEIKVKKRYQSEDLALICRDLVHMNYIPAVETEEITTDDACIRTEFPWVLEPNSSFLRVWGYVILIIALLASLLIPYFAFFYRMIPDQIKIVFTIINLAYLMDVIFVCITAQEMPGGRVSKSKEILKLKVKGIYFIVDVFGALPLYSLLSNLMEEENARLRPLFLLNYLIGMIKVHKFFSKLEHGFEVDLLILRIVKYIFYFTVVAYWFGSIFYTVACFMPDCLENSWFAFLTRRDEQTTPQKVRHNFPFAVSIYFGLLVMTQTAFGDVVPYNLAEVLIVIVFQFIGTFLFCYLIADYSATLTIEGFYKIEFLQFIAVMTRILDNNKIPPALKQRIFKFMHLQWQHRKGYSVLKEKPMMWDLPVRLYTSLRIEHLSKELKSIPFLASMGDDVLDKLALLVDIYTIPPNEVVAYSGSTVKEFYIIEEGNCSMIDGKNRVVRTIRAMQFFNLFEMLMGLKSIYNIKTATHCRVVRVSMQHIQEVMQLLNIESMQEKLDEVIHEMKDSVEVKRLKVQKTVTIGENVMENTCAGYLFTAGHRAHPNVDYLDPFNHIGFLSGLRFVLMPITINPNGSFMYSWEISRGVFAFCSSIIFPILPYLMTYKPGMIYVPLFLDFTALADIYIRMHTCFYNEEGLLVLHPLVTAIHYFSSSFVIDLLAWLPLNYFIGPHPVDGNADWFWVTHWSSDIIRCNRILQMHRLVSWFVYQENQILRKTAHITFCKYFIISLMFLNTLASILEFITIRYQVNPHSKQVNYDMLKQQHSWIYSYHPDFTLDTIGDFLTMHLIAYYWTASVALAIGPGDISAQNVEEMVYVCTVVVLGFLFYTYVLAILANAKASLDLNLTMYQERMQSLVSFMTSENVSRDIQKKAIHHFERVWQRTRGVPLNTICTKFNVTLKEDYLLQIYMDTFRKVSVFEDERSAFFRELAAAVEVRYFISGEDVMRQNDVVSHIMIVHHGQVRGINCVGEKVLLLGRGSIIGNIICDSPAVRMNMLFVAERNADILFTDSYVFFSILKEHTGIISKLDDHVHDGKLYVPSSDVSRKEEKKKTYRPHWLQKSFKMSADAASQDSRSDLGEGGRGAAARKANRSSSVDEKELPTKDRPGNLRDTPRAASMDGWGETAGSKRGTKSKPRRKNLTAWLMITARLLNNTFCTVCVNTSLLLSVIMCSFDLGFQSEELFIPIQILEVKYAIIIFLNFFRCYEDPNTGETVTDLAKIRNQYLKSWTGFILDFIAIMPIGLVLRYTTSHYAMTLGNTLHLLRMIKVYRFIEVKSDRLNVKVVYIKMMVIAITFTLIFHIMACVWNAVHCPRNICNEADKICDSNYICAIYYTTTTLIGTGYGDMGPTRILEYVYVVAMIVFSRFIFAMFIGDITNTVQTNNFSFQTYEYQLMRLKKYLSVNGVNTSVVRPVVEYCTRLWAGHSGEQIPAFFRMANICLQQDLSNEIYGKHFTECFLFVGLHKDLLRQVACCCEQIVYHPNDIIAHERQVNNRMYIIHKGAVQASNSDGNTLNFQQRDFFGVPQGLYENMPHSYTYKALKVCVILSLCFDDWSNLLQFFPASRVELYDRIERLERMYIAKNLSKTFSIQSAGQ
ncbi:uncharacterized protein LOC111052522 isoform X2 [Nilaparvata lugens]|nr:uncharacterized protein LOC111052522 isoform X2 [Nilaparvata lugens]